MTFYTLLYEISKTLVSLSIIKIIFFFDNETEYGKIYLGYSILFLYGHKAHHSYLHVSHTIWKLHETLFILVTYFPTI